VEWYSTKITILLSIGGNEVKPLQILTAKKGGEKNPGVSGEKKPALPLRQVTN
jgi:hypothetical protein